MIMVLGLIAIFGVVEFATTQGALAGNGPVRDGVVSVRERMPDAGDTKKPTTRQTTTQESKKGSSQRTLKL
jgi:hypothetical protein